MSHAKDDQGLHKGLLMKLHLRRWGAVYLLLALFLGSWAGQFFAQIAEITDETKTHGESFNWPEFWPQFWSATFENWQSEWLQLFVQAAVLLGMKHLIFKADAEDIERLDAKLDRLLEHHGFDVKQVEREINIVERGKPD
jgi:hypothetical protein